MDAKKIANKSFGEVVMAGFLAANQKMIKRAKLENKTLVIERDGKPVRVKARDL